MVEPEDNKMNSESKEKDMNSANFNISPSKKS